MTFTITPMSPVLGAEIRGVDLASDIDEPMFAAIRTAFLEHGVIVFREQAQTLGAAAQVAFARRFGELHRHPAAPADDDEGAVFVIHAHRDSTVANGNGWHTDVSCDEQPPAATMLQIHTLPDGGGGDTLFASMEAAYAVLPTDEQDRLRGLRAVHTSEHVYRGRYADRGVDDDGVEYPSATHPVVRTHPETGRPSIYVNRSFTTAIEGLDADAGRGLIRRLCDHAERPEFQVRLRWERNDVALWDNRCLQHFAIWDYWPNDRMGNRVSIAGDEPFFDPDAPGPRTTSIRMSVGSL